MRNMSFSLTTDQVRKGDKDVTRRIGWKNIKVGEVIMACVKCQGLKKGEKVEKIRPIRIKSSRWEPLDLIDEAECVREGFPNLTPDQFIDMFVSHNKCARDEKINRIEFEYI